MRRLGLVAMGLMLTGCGLTGGPASLTPRTDEQVMARLEPSDTQAKADKKAHDWAGDARQIGVGWAFYKSTLIAATTHVYTSRKQHQVLIVAFAGTSWLCKQRIDDNADHARLAELLGTVQLGSVSAKQVYENALSAGLQKQDVTIGGLIQPRLPLVPAIWTFDVNKPRVFLDAKNGKPLVNIASDFTSYLVPDWFDPQK